jgi:rod shape-determining protein MreB
LNWLPPFKIQNLKLKIQYAVIKRFFGRFSQDMGIDLGTANTLVHVAGRGVVLREPSVVAMDLQTNLPRAVGEDAKLMVGRTPSHIVAIRPLKDGVIADYEITRDMLIHFIRRVHRGHRFAYPRIMVGIPSGITEVEKRAVIQAANTAGARESRTIEVAVISLGGIVTSRSLRIAGDEIDEAIIAHVRRSHNMLIGERTAEMLKISIGSAYALGEELATEIKGRDLVNGLPKSVIITSPEIREAIREPVREIVETVKATLEQSPPELAADIMERGIVLAGGGALLRGLDQLLAHETQIPVHVADDPLTCVALGTGEAVEAWDTWSRSNHAVYGAS